MLKYATYAQKQADSTCSICTSSISITDSASSHTGGAASKASVWLAGSYVQHVLTRALPAMYRS